MLRGSWLLVPVVLLAGSACAHRSSTDEVQPVGAPAYVEVTNHFSLPMEIFVGGSGINQRLGTVHPGMSGHFVIPSTLVGNSSVRFEARPTGNGTPFRSGDILLAPGTVVDFTIADVLFNSTVTRRP